MSGHLFSAVINEFVSRISSDIIGKYRERNSVQEWRDRLVMAEIQLKSALLESEEFDINNDEPLHKWKEKLKKVLCEAEETLSNFQAEGLHTASNIAEAITREVLELEANLPHDPFRQEEGSDDPTLVHPASNFKEAVTRQVDLEENLHHDPLLQEEGSDDATFVHPASNLREAVAHQVDQQANLPHDPLMQEEGSDDATLVHPASNLMEAVTRQVDLQANLPQGQPMQGEGSDGATLVHGSLNLLKAVIRFIQLQANLPHDQPMQEEGSDGATLVHPSINLLKAVLRRMQLQANLPHDGVHTTLSRLKALIRQLKLGNGNLYKAVSPILIKLERLVLLSSILDRIKKFSYFSNLPLQVRKGLSCIYPGKKWLNKYLENDKNVSKLKNTVEKLERMVGDLGTFIKLLELQKKRKMNRKRKRSGVALQGFFLVISLKLQTNALFCYGEDTYLLVTKMFHANCTVPTEITGDIFIGFIM